MITKAVRNFQDASQSRKGEEEGEDWEEREEGKEAAQKWSQLRGRIRCEDVEYITTNDLHELRGGIIHDEGGEMILGAISPKTLTLFSAMSSIQFTNFTSHFVALVQLS